MAQPNCYTWASAVGVCLCILFSNERILVNPNCQQNNHNTCFPLPTKLSDILITFLVLLSWPRSWLFCSSRGSISRVESEEQLQEEGAPNCPPLTWEEAYPNNPWETPLLTLEWAAPYRIFMPKLKGCILVSQRGQGSFTRSKTKYVNLLLEITLNLIIANNQYEKYKHALSKIRHLPTAHLKPFERVPSL